MTETIVRKEDIVKAEKVQSYREQFLKEKSELVARIEALESNKGRAIPANSTEQAVDIQNDEVVDQLENIEIKRLQDIDLALDRMDNGKFGICSSCGEEISEARIKAMPAASICMNCLKEEE